LENEIPVVKFSKRDVNEEIAREPFKRAEREGCFWVVMVGIAQERTSGWRGWRDGGPDGSGSWRSPTPRVRPTDRGARLV
jgi:hypothetical protein